MKIKYLGTAAAEGVPAMFCNCDTCKKVRELGGKEIRARSSVLINDDLCVDFSADIYMQSIKFGIDLSKIKYLFITHSHADHFYGQSMLLRGYKFAYNLCEPILNIYGDREVSDIYKESTKREIIEAVSQNINFNVVQPYTEIEIDKYKITALPAKHTINEKSLLYLIENDNKSILYLNDTGRIEESVYDYLEQNNKKIDLVNFDCTYTDCDFGENKRHMGVIDNEFVKRKLIEFDLVSPETKYVITHFSHNSKPFTERLDKIADEHGFISAYDGFEIEI